MGIMCRISLNLVKGELTNDQEGQAKFLNWAAQLYQAGVKQLTIRELGVPDRYEHCNESFKKIEWVKGNALDKEVVEMIRKTIKETGRELRTMPYGAAVYDFMDMSVCLTTCMTNNKKEDEIRSLILQPDGHIYHTWDYKGSILF